MTDPDGVFLAGVAWGDMRAVVSASGQLMMQEVPDVSAGYGEVLIKVRAAGVNRADLLQAVGRYPPPPGASEIMGLEVSGVIVEVGSGVVDLAVGQEVCALLSGGGYAEYVAAPAAQVIPIPAGVALDDAAGLPEVACTVWSNLVMAARLTAGEFLLLHGGASGIGSHAIQIARVLGVVSSTIIIADSLDQISPAIRKVPTPEGPAGSQVLAVSPIEQVRTWQNRLYRLIPEPIRNLVERM